MDSLLYEIDILNKENRLLNQVIELHNERLTVKIDAVSSSCRETCNELSVNCVQSKEELLQRIIALEKTVAQQQEQIAVYATIMATLKNIEVRLQKPESQQPEQPEQPEQQPPQHKKWWRLCM